MPAPSASRQSRRPEDVEPDRSSFGSQLIRGEVTLTIPAGEICVMLGPSEWLVDDVVTSPAGP